MTDRPAEAEAPAKLKETLARLRTRAWWGPVSRTPMLGWRMGLGSMVGRVMAVLTTTGRRTGLPRRTVVSYVPAGERAYVVAVYGPRSQWFRNLIADPRVGLQTAGGTRAMLARRMAGDEDLRGAYGDLQAQLGPGTDALLSALGAPGGLDGLLEQREDVLLVRLEPTAEPAPPPVRADLAWVLPTLAVSSAALLLRRRRGRRTA